jgi:hypothetical protein
MAWFTLANSKTPVAAPKAPPVFRKASAASSAAKVSNVAAASEMMVRRQRVEL